MDNALRRAFTAAIAAYQRILSPDHAFWARAAFPGGFCRFHPSCSEYARRVIARDGVVVGTVLATWRILRCNPWSKGGLDEP